MTRGFWWSARGLSLRTNALLALAGVSAAAPLAAGLAGHGGATIVALIAAFVFAEVLGKPWVLPDAPTWRALAPLARQAAWKTAGVLALYGIGAGVAALTGWRPGVPLWLPVAMAVGAALASRAIWRPLPPDFATVIDNAIAGIEGRGTFDPTDGPTPEEAARDAVLRHVANLPDGMPDAEAQRAIVDAMLRLADDPETALEDFRRLLDQGLVSRTGRRGFILWATDPATLAEGRWPQAPARALNAANEDPEALALFAARAANLLAARPHAWEDFPTESGVRRAAVGENGVSVNAPLRALARAIRAATPPEFRDGSDGSPLPPETRAIRQAERVLARIAPDADDAAALAALATAERRCFMALADILDDRARAGDRRAARLLVLHATRPDVLGWLAGVAPTHRAFDRAAADAELTILFVRRAVSLVREQADHAWDMPVPAELRARALALPAAAEAIADLHALVAPVLEPEGPEE